MKDPETGWVEADVTINGKALSFAESMTLRVAVNSFQMWCAHGENREGLGTRLADNYDRHAGEIMRAMLRRP